METIFSLITGRTQSPVAVFRISGLLTLQSLKDLTKRIKWNERYLYCVNIYDCQSNLIDKGMAVFFQAPRSYTGEDLCEIHIHGSFVLINRLTSSLSDMGLRQAFPGEFTKRSFLNKKMDLIQAESVHELICSNSYVQCSKALQSLDGQLSQVLQEISDDIISMISAVDYKIDFLETEDHMLDQDLMEKSQKVIRILSEQVHKYDEKFDSGKKYIIGIFGRTNVGKSSLFNILVNDSRSIVSPYHGTTRDYIDDTLFIRGIGVSIIDTAGIRSTESQVEEEGIKKTYSILEKSDIKIFLFDNTCDPYKESYIDLIKKKDFCVFNKGDLNDKTRVFPFCEKKNQFLISCHSGRGIKSFKESLYDALQSQNEQYNHYSLYNARHITLIKECLHSMNSFLSSLQKEKPEISIIFLKESLLSLEYLLGSVSSEDILNNIFSNFCVGK